MLRVSQIYDAQRRRAWTQKKHTNKIVIDIKKARGIVPRAYFVRMILNGVETQCLASLRLSPPAILKSIDAMDILMRWMYRRDGYIDAMDVSTRWIY